MLDCAPTGTVYIVDDDGPVRDSLKLLLESHGMTVRDFESCGDFLDATGEGESGCLLLDLHLPAVSGLDFVRAHRDRLEDLPVIMISGRSDLATRAQAYEAGVVDFLEKPFPDDALLDSIHRAMEGAAG